MTNGYYHHIQHAFNKAANSYDDNCLVQQQVGKKLIQLAKSYLETTPSNLIDLGCGTGIITEELAAQFDFQTFHAIDIATKLLKLASDRLKHTGVQVYPTNFDELPSIHSSFDLIFSNMALHWSTNIALTFKSLIALMNPHSLFAFSIPLTGTFLELPANMRNSFFTSSDIQQKLDRAGFNLLAHHHEKIATSFENTLSGLRLIKKTGVNYVRDKKQLGLKGKSFLKQLHLQQLTYCIGYFIVKRTK